MAPLKISLSYLGETPKIDEESGIFFLRCDTFAIIHHVTYRRGARFDTLPRNVCHRGETLGRRLSGGCAAAAQRNGKNANASSLPIPMEPQNNHQNKTNQK